MPATPNVAPQYPMYAAEDTEPSMVPHPDVSNPVLTAEDVTDRDEATGVADPFLVYEDGTYHMFLEVIADDHPAHPSVHEEAIGHATSEDGLHWEYNKVVVDDPGHFAFPHVFKWQGAWYMVPDSGRGENIHFYGGISRVYRADSFPEEWSLVDRPLMRFGLCDPTVFRFEDTWYLIGGLYGEDGYLGNCLYYADSLVGAEWHEHPASRVHDPLVPAHEPNRIARPGGRPIVHDDYVDFFYQDWVRRSEDKVRVVRITDLTRETYNAVELPCSPAVEGQLDEGWNHEKMHHVDAGLAYSGVKNVIGVDGSSGPDFPEKNGFAIGLYCLE